MNDVDRAPGDGLTTEQAAEAGTQAGQVSSRQQPPQRQDATAPARPARQPPGDADIVPGDMVGEGDGPAAGREGLADDSAGGAGPAGEGGAGADVEVIAGADPADDDLDDEDAFDDDLLDEDVFDDQVLIEDEDAPGAGPGGLPANDTPGAGGTGASGTGAAGGIDDGSFAGDPQPHAHLLEGEELRDMVMRWKEIQAQFVDEPRTAVADADALVAELMHRLARLFADERAQLESRWADGDDVSTEDLRQGLRRYRSFFERLLAA